jgi:hypothetical protein
MFKVNTLIIGAGRSGTTSLYHYLARHPDICFSDIKEVHFFSIKDLYKRGENYFHSYFSAHTNQKIIASADTYLLIDKEAPQRILSYNPAMKFIVLLREPVARSYSSYHYALNNGYQDKKLKFIDSLKYENEYLKEDIISVNNRCHFYGSLYYNHLKTWMDCFPKENFLVLKTDDFEKNTDAVLSALSSFLMISEFPVPKEKIFINKAAPVKSRKLQQFLLNRNHPFRKLLRPLIKPFRTLIIKTGIVDKIHHLNKEQKEYGPLSEEEKKTAKDYFRQELENLRKEFNITFD